MQKISAGLLMCRLQEGSFQFFLVHPGGPFFRNKHAGIWTIPKGIPEQGEDLPVTARREFSEETGITPSEPLYALGTIKQKAGKLVHAWSFWGSWEPEDGLSCNTFEVEWPPRSGKKLRFPEIDRAQWFDYDAAKEMIIAEQIPLLDRAREIMGKNAENHPSSA